MTREEAITILGDYEYILFEDEDTYNREAFRMAIQALSQEPTKEEQALLQKWRDNRGISIEEFEDAMNTLQEPCDDAISREELLKAIDTWDKFGYTETGCFVREPKGDYVPYIHYVDVIKCIKGMPSVTQKSGKWIKVKSGDKDFPESIVCSRCRNENSHLDFNENAEPIGKVFVTSKFCPNCGAKMVEPQESEDKE